LAHFHAGDWRYLGGIGGRCLLLLLLLLLLLILSCSAMG
jgi:hypothetical protein